MRAVARAEALPDASAIAEAREGEALAVSGCVRTPREAVQEMTPEKWDRAMVRSGTR